MDFPAGGEHALDILERRLRADVGDDPDFTPFQLRQQFGFHPLFRVASRDDENISGGEFGNEFMPFPAAEQDLIRKFEFAVHSFPSCSVR